MSSDVSGYDIIGDVHGHASKLVGLMESMGYSSNEGVWSHSSRMAVFVGDLIDRGPEQLETVRIVKAMVEAGTAHVVLGNHEFNAVAWRTPDSLSPGEYLRPHSTKNHEQHDEFLEQVGENSAQHGELIAWFMTLPLWLELEGLRVVHACWDADSLAAISPLVSGNNSLTPELVEAASLNGSPAWQAIEHLLKGPEVAVEPGYLDGGGRPRHRARVRWWKEAADRLSSAVIMSAAVRGLDGLAYVESGGRAITLPVKLYVDRVPVFFGHYWATGEPTINSDYAACVDYSAGKDGPLIAYRYSGEDVLTSDNFASS